MKNTILVLGLMTLMQLPLMAQNTDSTNVETLDEVLVSSQRFDQKRRESPRQIEVVKSSKINELQPATLGDALINTGQVFVQKSQMGGSSPVLRGFEASRVLMVIDGVRMNNATYRAGHLQDIITIDPFILDRMEVNFGSGSTIFGSDALGGVLYFKTKDVSFGTKKWSPYANIRYQSASNGKIYNGGLEYQSQKFGAIFNITRSDFGDLSMGTKSYYAADENYGLMPKYVTQINGVDSVIDNPDKNVQKGTGYAQTDVFAKFGYRGKKILHTVNFQASMSELVPRYDRINENTNGKFTYARWDYAPQNRMFASYKMEFGNENHKNKFIMAYQNTEVARVSRKFRKTNEKTQLDKVNMITANFDRNDKVGKFTIQSGAEWVLNLVDSKGTLKNVNTGVVTPGDSRYSDSGAITNSVSLYGQANYTLDKTKTILVGGLRLTHYFLDAYFTKNNYWKYPLSAVYFSNVAPSFNLGFVQPIGNDILIRGSFNQAYRNPNVDDMTKVFDSKVGVKVLVPNADLGPEYSYTTDLSVIYKFNKFYIEAGGYRTQISNLMLDQRGTYNNADSLLYDGVMTPVYEVKNVASGVIQGFYANVKLNVWSKLWLNVNGNITKGTYKNAEGVESPLDHIPPFYGQASLKWTESNWYAEFQCLFNGKKELAEYSNSGEDNLDKNPATGNPAWQIYTLRTGYQFSKQFSAALNIENLLDLRYRYFASGLTAPGRSVNVTVSYKF